MMRVIFLILLLFGSQSFGQTESLEKSIQELRQEVEELKLQRDLDYFTFGGSLVNRYDHVNNFSKAADQ